MADTNRVEFGLKNLYFGTYTVGTDGTVTLGTPFHVPGAKSLTLEADGEDFEIYADDTKYYATYQDNGYTGSVEVVRFPDEFYTQFCGYKKVTGGGIAAIKGATKPSVYICFEGKGDAQARRVMLLNVTLGGVGASHATTEKSPSEQNQSVNITVVGDNKTGISKAVYNPGDTNYETLFTTPTMPTIADTTE